MYGVYIGKCKTNFAFHSCWIQFENSLSPPKSLTTPNVERQEAVSTRRNQSNQPTLRRGTGSHELGKVDKPGRERPSQRGLGFQTADSYARRKAGG